MRRGDVLVCWKLDRLSRSLSDLLRILLKVDEAGAKFKSLTEEIDTTTPVGRMVMKVGGSFAEFERSIIKERTKLGLAVLALMVELVVAAVSFPLPNRPRRSR